MSVVSQEIDLPSLNQMFESAKAQSIVQWAVAQFGDALVMSSSFGADSAVLLHMASQTRPGIKVIFVDTGYLFPETHAYMEQLRALLNLNIWTYRTRNDPISYLQKAGEDNPNDRKNIDACCAANKNEPFERAMKQLGPRAWMRGIRRDQAETRRQAAFVDFSTRYNCYAISPLLNLSSRDLHEYIKSHDLPRHPLWEKGYSSIGCNPASCTEPVEQGQQARSGRWAGKDKYECGINITKNSLDSANL